MTLEELTKVLTYAATAYDRELTEDMIAVYFDQLGRHGCAQFAAAIRHHVASCDRFPTVSDIRRAMDSLARRAPDPSVSRNNEIARRVTEARKSGWTPEEIDALIETLEKKLSTNKQQYSIDSHGKKWSASLSPPAETAIPADRGRNNGTSS